MFQIKSKRDSELQRGRAEDKENAGPARKKRKPEAKKKRPQKTKLLTTGKTLGKKKKDAEIRQGKGREGGM